jgi:predicted DNA-binding transcriptional regulator AlpA
MSPRPEVESSLELPTTVSLAQLASLLGCSISTIQRRRRDDDCFPQPIASTGRLVRFDRRAVTSWLANN